MRLGRDPAQQRVRVLEALARVRAVLGDHLRVRPPHALEHRIRQAVQVVGAQDPGREMREGAVEDRLVPGPQVPLAGVGPELDVGDRAERRGLLQLPGVDRVVGGQGPRRPRVRGADVDERHRAGVAPERLAERGEAGPRVRHDRALAGGEPLPQERDRTGDVLLRRLVDERVVPQRVAVTRHSVVSKPRGRRGQAGRRARAGRAPRAAWPARRPRSDGHARPLSPSDAADLLQGLRGLAEPVVRPDHHPLALVEAADGVADGVDLEVVEDLVVRQLRERVDDRVPDGGGALPGRLQRLLDRARGALERPQALELRPG